MEGKTLVDIGGSFGVVMEAVAEKYPGIGKIYSLDLEKVIKAAPKPKNDKVKKHKIAPAITSIRLPLNLKVHCTLRH